MLSDELIKKLKDYPAFQEYLVYIIAKIEELDSIDGLEQMTNQRAGEEAKVRGKATAKLYELLAPFVELTEKREPTKEQVNQAKEKFGL